MSLTSALTRRAAPPALLALLAAGLLASCGKDEAPGRGGAGGPPAVVTTTVLAPSPWSDELRAIGTAILGIILFAESADAMRLGCIGLIVAGIAGLKFVSA